MLPYRRWVGDCTLVSAMAETFVKQRMNPETHALEAISIPDHIDILGKLACGKIRPHLQSCFRGSSDMRLRSTPRIRQAHSSI
jgi:hypothetical protein